VTSVVVSGRADLTDAQCLLRPDRVLADKAYSSRAPTAPGWAGAPPSRSQPTKCGGSGLQFYHPGGIKPRIVGKAIHHHPVS
jgi:hypothetical protein